MFSSGVSFGLSSSSEANSISSGNGPTSTVFASRWQPSKSPFFCSTLNPTAPSTVFSFGASPASVAAPNISSMVVGSSPGTSTGSLFSFTVSAANSSSTSLTSSHPVFGNSNHGFTFGSASGNNDQMSMDYTMAEDNKRKPRPSQATFAPFVPKFGQPPSSSPSISFVFNSITPSGANPFQFGGRQNPSQATFGANPFQFGNQQSSAARPNQSPFRASGSLDFNARGSFSLSSGGGGDKSNHGFTFGSASGNNDQMSMEDTMAEDAIQAFTPSVPNFGQPPSSSPSPGFVFNSITPSGANPFQFGGQQNPATIQNPSQATFGANPFQFGNQQSSAAPPNQSPIQASGSLDFNAGWSFSLGSGGGDKSNRRILKVKRNVRKK